MAACPIRLPCCLLQRCGARCSRLRDTPCLAGRSEEQPAVAATSPLAFWQAPLDAPPQGHRFAAGSLQEDAASLPMWVSAKISGEDRVSTPAAASLRDPGEDDASQSAQRVALTARAFEQAPHPVPSSSPQPLPTTPYIRPFRFSTTHVSAPAHAVERPSLLPRVSLAFCPRHLYADTALFLADVLAPAS